MVLRYDSLSFTQRSKPPLDLKIFISSNAFNNPAFFYKQLELTRFVFALITNILKSRGEVDTTGGKPLRATATTMFFPHFVGDACSRKPRKRRIRAVVAPA